MAPMAEYEFRTIVFPRDAARSAIRQELADHEITGYPEVNDLTAPLRAAG